MLYESFKNVKKDKNLNNLTASATLLPKQLIYYANFDDHYVKSKFQFLSMFLVVSGGFNELKNLFSRHPDIPEASRNDPWQKLKNDFFHHFGPLEVIILDHALTDLESIELRCLTWITH